MIFLWLQALQREADGNPVMVKQNKTKTKTKNLLWDWIGTDTDVPAAEWVEDCISALGLP